MALVLCPRGGGLRTGRDNRRECGPGRRVPRLTPDQIDLLAHHGKQRRIGPGEVLNHEGGRCQEFLVVLAGTVEIRHGYGGPEERVPAVHGPGSFIGELNLRKGEPALYAAVVGETGECIPPEDTPVVIWHGRNRATRSEQCRTRPSGRWCGGRAER